MSAVFTTQQDLARYKKLEKLGEGTYGLVYKALDLKTNQYVALKKIKLDNNEEGIPATTIREVSLLSALRHQNVILLNSSLYVDGELHLVFEYMTCDLKGYLDMLDRQQFLPAIEVKKFSYYLIEGMRYCHSRRILHRDLKPQNILIGDNGVLKIADFGLGREHGLPIAKLTHEVVTLWYRPPEILLGAKKYSGACDVWSIACIIAETATKVPLFPGDSEIDQIFQIYRCLGTPTEDIWPGVTKLPDFTRMGPQWKKKDLKVELKYKIDDLGINLLSQMLCYPPNKRITCVRALCHEWFDEIREDMISQYGFVYPHCGSKQFQLRRRRAHKTTNQISNILQPSNNNNNNNNNNKINHNNKKRKRAEMESEGGTDIIDLDVYARSRSMEINQANNQRLKQKQNQLARHKEMSVDQ